MPLSSQREISQRQATERQLQEIRDALIGYAQANNALPCPVQAGTGNVVQPIPTAVTVCNPAFDSVPYATLGIQGTVDNNNLVDTKQSYFRYRLTAANIWSYAKVPVPIAPLPANQPDLRVCTSGVGASLVACGAGLTSATTVVAVVISIGENGTPSADEVQNTNNDRIFVMRPLAQSFDDIVVWVSQSTLTYKLSQAGQ